jgi:hypothetical protein
MNKTVSAEFCGGNVSLYALGVTISQPQYAQQAGQMLYSSCSKVRSACSKANSVEGMTSCADAEKDASDIAKLYAAAQQVNTQSQYQTAAMMNGSMFGQQQSPFGGNPLVNPFGQPGLNGMPSSAMLPGAVPGFPGAGTIPGVTPNYMSPTLTSANFNPGLYQSPTSFQGPMYAGGAYSNPFSRGF